MTPNIQFKVGAGSTLSGGVIRPAGLGEVGLRYFGSENSAGVRLFRRANSGSLLALTGKSDPVTGIRWGRVIETGLDLIAYRRDEKWEHLGGLVLSRLEGQGVADNRTVQLLGRSLRELDSVPGLLLGSSATFTRFSRSLGAFEPGHGGYFSPVRSTTLSLYGRYVTKIATLALTFRGSVGLGAHQEAIADGNPLTGDRPGQYAALNSRGIGYFARIDGLQPIGSSWDLGFSFELGKGDTYSDRRASLFVQRRWGD